MEGGGILGPYLRPIYLLLESFPIEYTDSGAFGLCILAPGSFFEENLLLEVSPFSFLWSLSDTSSS